MRTHILPFFLFYSVIFIGLASSLNAQRNPCADGSCGPEYKVTSPQGLIIQKQPWESSGKVVKVPTNGRVYASDSLFGESITVVDKSGRYRKVNYGNQKGYMFEGFLEKVERIELFSCRSLKELETPFTTGEQLWGVYCTDKGTEVKKVTARPHGIEGDAEYIVQGEAPLFLLNNFKPKRTPYIAFGEKVDRFVAPGDVITLKVAEIKSSDTREYFLYGNGTVVPNPNGTYTELFKEVKSYSLRIRAMKGAVQIKDTEIFGSGKVPYKFGLEAQGPKVIWAGDLDGDDQLDILVEEPLAPQEMDCWNWSLFLSTEATNGYLFKETVRKKFCAN